MQRGFFFGSFSVFFVLFPKKNRKFVGEKFIYRHSKISVRTEINFCKDRNKFP